MSSYNCLIVDDEEALSVSTCEYFNIFGVTTYWVQDEVSCFNFLAKNDVDLILLDINLGDSSGFEVCKKLRQSTNIPILFISARKSDDDVLLALNIGGDDYIQKPYSLSILLAKVKIVLSRFKKTDTKTYSFDKFIFYPDSEKLMTDGNDIRLKSLESKLLLFFLNNRNRIITKDELFKKVWGDGITGDNTLNVHVRWLREKIEKDPNNPEFIKTVWGTGYVFEDKS